MRVRTSNTRCVLKGGRATSRESKVGGEPTSRASIPAAPASDYLVDEVGAAPHGDGYCAVKRGCATQRRGTQRRVGDTSAPVEVVQCAEYHNPPKLFERPIVPKGRPRLYCSKSCANYASRRRVKGTTGLTPKKVAMHNWQQAQRRAAPPPTFSQALHALRGLPDLHAILSDDLDAVESAHGHEALRRTPTEATSARAHPAETQQEPTPNRTRPKGERKRQ